MTEKTFLLASTISRAQVDDHVKQVNYPFYISERFRASSFILTRQGSENFHVYLWILKDLCWTQGLRHLSVLFGALALMWCAVLLTHAILQKDAEEIYMQVAVVLWLYGACHKIKAIMHMTHSRFCTISLIYSPIRNLPKLVD